MSRLRNYKPKPDERRTIESIPVPLVAVNATPEEPQQMNPESKPNNTMAPGSRIDDNNSDVQSVTVPAKTAVENDQELVAESSKNSPPPDQQPEDLPPDAPPPNEANDEQLDEDSAEAVGMEDGEEVDFPMEDDDCDTAMVEIVSTEPTFSFQSFVGSLKGESGQMVATLPSSSVGTRFLDASFDGVLHHFVDIQTYTPLLLDY